MKKIVYVISLISSIVMIMMLSSCFFNSVNDNALELDKKEVEFTNLSNDYTISNKRLKAKSS